MQLKMDKEKIFIYQTKGNKEVEAHVFDSNLYIVKVQRNWEVYPKGSTLRTASFNSKRRAIAYCEKLLKTKFIDTLKYIVESGDITQEAKEYNEQLISEVNRDDTETNTANNSEN